MSVQYWPLQFNELLLTESEFDLISFTITEANKNYHEPWAIVS